MKKLIYMTEVTEDSASIGVWKKIKMQINYFNTQNIKVKLYDVKKKKKSNVIVKIMRRMPFFSFYNWYVDKKLILDADCVYIRKTMCDYHLIKSLRRMKKNNPRLKIIMEIPTFPYDYEMKWTASNFLPILKDKWNRKKLYKYIDKILTYSKDDNIFGIPTLQLSNSVDINKINIKKTTDAEGSINVIAVAKFAFWHGYDRFIEGMYQYYKNNSKEKINIKLHLVGEGRELSQYKSLVNRYNLHNNVYFYGNKDGKALNEVYNVCEIGLDAMGRHRSNVYFNSTLKGKEYAAKGLPIISGVKTEFDLDSSYKYYMRVPADESPIDMESVINFYNQVYKMNESKDQIIRAISRYAKNRFDISVVWKKVVSYIKEE